MKQEKKVHKMQKIIFLKINSILLNNLLENLQKLHYKYLKFDLKFWWLILHYNVGNIIQKHGNNYDVSGGDGTGESNQHLLPLLHVAPCKQVDVIFIAIKCNDLWTNSAIKTASLENKCDLCLMHRQSNKLGKYIYSFTH